MQDSVLPLLPSTKSLTLDEGMEFVERTRRQIARFEMFTGRASAQLDPAKVGRISTLLDEIESAILANPNYERKTV